MAGVRPEPPAAFSALATTRSSSCSLDQARHGAADDVAARLADDVADEEDSHGCQLVVVRAELNRKR